MRIAILHTYYRQPGGEDRSFEQEVALLSEKGHRIFPITLHNKDLLTLNAWNKTAVTIWNHRLYKKLAQDFLELRPDLLHIQNTFPLASPAVLHAAKAAGVPVVMTLRNYRLMCLNALFHRKQQVCQACTGQVPWRGVLHACYHGSRTESTVVATMILVHRILRTWEIADRFITLTEFARERFLEAGFNPSKLVVKPNFVNPDPGPGHGLGRYALYVGRLSPEKGVETMLQAWKSIAWHLPLKIVGNGPLAETVSRASRQMSNVEWLGHKSPKEVYELMGNASFLIFPSEWYETFGRVAIEAFAKGTPVVAANIGAVGEITDHGRTGLHFRPGDPQDLAAKVEWLLSHPEELARMRREARAEYEAKYTAERNYQMLMEIYEGVLASHKRG